MSLSVANSRYPTSPHSGPAVFWELLFLDIERKIKWVSPTLAILHRSLPVKQFSNCDTQRDATGWKRTGTNGENSMSLPWLHLKLLCSYGCNTLRFSLRLWFIQLTQQIFTEHLCYPRHCSRCFSEKSFCGTLILISKLYY